MNETNQKSFFSFSNPLQIHRGVKLWLIAGLIMVFMQIIIGGITRLTGSGLSITKWDIVTGTLPPLNEAQWQSEFELYQLTPQYKKINEGMPIEDFKFIYFWEYFHRLWARTMGFVFLIGFGIFLFKGMFSRELFRRLGLLVSLAALEGFFGWIMVASGLRERPWVNAYNLTLHLGMGFTIFSVLLWITFRAFQPSVKPFLNQALRKQTLLMLYVLGVQILLGALMSGMKAGLVYPSWPKMGAEWAPNMIFDLSQWHWTNFLEYDKNPFAPALVQFVHRGTAYLTAILGVFLFIRLRNTGAISRQLSIANVLVILLLTTQVVLGILTLINCKVHIPVALGSLHQGCAIFLLSALLFVYYQMSKKYVQ